MVDTVVELLQAHPHLPVVCDRCCAPVAAAVACDEVGYAMRERLLPLSLIATPNLLRKRDRGTARRQRRRLRREAVAVHQAPADHRAMATSTKCTTACGSQ